MRNLAVSKRIRSTSFALVTSLLAGVIAATGALDLVTGSVNLSPWWTVFVTAVSMIAATVPFVMGTRFPPLAALMACWAFGCVTALQVAQSTDAIMAVNNIVLYPMVSCYLGWFFAPKTARIHVTALFSIAGVGVWASEFFSVFTTWANLALASFFCLEAALYLRAKLDRQIETDPLTGALNRTGLEAQLRAELARARRGGESLSVAMVDLDGFKNINDRLGHASGDRVLIELVKELQTGTRPKDFVARIGGDEFVVILPGTSFVEAGSVIQHLRDRSQSAWTFGIAEADSEDTADSVVSRADDHLYVRKRSRGSLSLDDSATDLP